LEDLYNLGINRLSIGIQSFFDDDLEKLNRRHTSADAQNCVKLAQKVGFTNITVDLIYGLPNQTMERWKQNLDKVAQLNIQHLSAYALSVEKSTALHKFVRTGKVIIPQDEQVISQFEYLVEWSKNQGFEQYEISNFAKNDMYSKHNSNYWKGVNYLGVGPSAHSFNGTHRFWNIAHNQKYIQQIQAGIIPHECEELSIIDRFNEYIMTSLRTKWGVEIEFIKTNFPNEYYCNFTELIKTYISQELMHKTQTHVCFSTKGFMLSDAIIAELFVVK
jgi:oxygen-independent coproporphyrinogen-3 oxidase